jgi:hypothetical protein
LVDAGSLKLCLQNARQCTSECWYDYAKELIRIVILVR